MEVDSDSIGAFLRDKVVLVTGAGGSIGSEIVMQAASFRPERLILFDIDETELHRMELKLKKIYPRHFNGNGSAGGRFAFVVGDIGNSERVRRVFSNYRPEIVFHAAAYKHVPMMEHNPEEAVRVNMFGTHVLADCAARSGVRKFIMISSDKAVMPSSVMGATKRMAENICAAFGSGRTAFISVRFGNVLGSRGSVLPIFMEQLKSGGPLTVTHREIKRYFMTISEAVSLVLQAAVIGKGGEVLVLDMGEPVRIADLAEELIRINGLEPYKDVGIEFTGLRAGEKLYEEVFTDEEVLKVSAHRKILISRSAASYTLRDIERILGEFEPHLSGAGRHKELKGLLRKYVEHTAEAGLEEVTLQGRVV
ncbi:MAG: polysaccharide biosynthesis protein [Deltaproteobacteria bacterium]|nr:polysaccharide biosynthesis protein [Deltaproteobacteria bacterium]